MIKLRVKEVAEREGIRNALDLAKRRAKVKKQRNRIEEVPQIKGRSL
jgi:hypothetical protein